MNQTYEQFHRHIRQHLEPVTNSAQQAEFEADWMLKSLLNVTPEQRYSQPDKLIPQADIERVQDFLTLRTEKRIPIQYLFHEAWFFGLPFYVNPHVLIPRPETELLVEQVLSVAADGMHILDMGTGPGTIAVTLAARLQKQSIRITAIDVSEQALKVAQLNQKRHQTDVIFQQGDLFTPLTTERFDIIVSNPPYVDEALKDTLTPEVLWHEPSLALFSPDKDAFYFYKKLAQDGKGFLKPGGRLMMEMGLNMAEEIRQILENAGYQSIDVLDDYAGHERVITGRYA
jgi:release factor glutamine methyltransferase